MSLYPPPRELSTRVFAELPRDFRIHDGESEWGAANKPGQRVDSFLEGPSFDRAGNLYVSDIPYGRIFRISPAGTWELVVQYDGWPNGLKIHATAAFSLPTTGGESSFSTRKSRL